jgi:hypothetical protein
VTTPTGPHALLADLRWPDGLEAVFKVAGDALCVDAHILKWHPLANLLGLHSGYESVGVEGVKYGHGRLCWLTRP